MTNEAHSRSVRAAFEKCASLPRSAASRALYLGNRALLALVCTASQTFVCPVTIASALILVKFWRERRGSFCGIQHRSFLRNGTNTSLEPAAWRLPSRVRDL